ncbi:MAG: nitroreductase family protein, partial [Rikenellaceae bacterium]
IYQRWSVRHFTDRKVEKDTLIELVRAAMAAPTGKDKRPWEFVVVTERETLDRLSDALPFAKMLSTATAAVVICGNTDEQNGGSPYWFLDCSAATQNLLLAAQSMNLGSVWTAAYPYKERIDPVKDILSIPDHITPLCVVPIGYPSKEPRVKDKFEIEKIHTEKW